VCSQFSIIKLSWYDKHSYLKFSQNVSNRYLGKLWKFKCYKVSILFRKKLRGGIFSKMRGIALFFWLVNIRSFGCIQTIGSEFPKLFIDKKLFSFYLLRKTEFICLTHTDICPTLHQNIFAYLCSIKARIFFLELLE